MQILRVHKIRSLDHFRVASRRFATPKASRLQDFENTNAWTSSHGSGDVDQRLQPGFKNAKGIPLAGEGLCHCTFWPVMRYAKVDTVSHRTPPIVYRRFVGGSCSWGRLSTFGVNKRFLITKVMTVLFPFQSSCVRTDPSLSKNMADQKPTEPKTYSRLDQRARDAGYLANFCEEHNDNFRDFLLKMVECKTLAKLTSNARDICLKVCTHMNLAPVHYLDTISRSYTRFEAELNSVNNANKAMSVKNQLCDDMKHYFSFLKSHVGKSQIGAPGLAAVFQKKPVALEEFGRRHLGQDYNEEDANRYYYPQLFLFYGRFFDVYDGAIRGRAISDAMNAVEKEHQSDHVRNLKSNPAGLSEAWAGAGANVPSGPIPTFNYDKNEEPSNPQVEETLVSLGEAYNNAMIDLSALYNHKGQEWKDRWTTLTREEMVKWMELSREHAASRAEMGVMYCPEMNAQELAENGGKGMLDMMEECRKFSQDISQLDPFVSKIWMAMKAKGIESKKALITIVYSRRYVRMRGENSEKFRWTLLVFCVNVIVEALQLVSHEDQASGEPQKPSAPTTAQSFEQIVEKTISTLATEESTPLPKRDRSNPLERADPNLKRCAYSKCKNRETSDKKFQVCGRCKAVDVMVAYCSRDCQSKHWTEEDHKSKCGKKPASDDGLRKSERVEEIDDEEAERMAREALDELKLRKQKKSAKNHLRCSIPSVSRAAAYRCYCPLQEEASPLSCCQWIETRCRLLGTRIEGTSTSSGGWADGELTSA
ncbi:hypothetical protein PROFUN_02877 [Planoprotostelium fungivorum]|uniref:MYND-type domain-containing protein n=1 Tax=Planoprotostelium fungivorum TaxID=1890364 RepID=A0A2P6NS80_9EUKA|nr:hypothetical protein PROFUN_02877 [Planoprotostelium fungivorum]